MADKILMKQVPLDRVTWDERYRKDLGNIEGMTESIREKGVLQPITVVTADPDGNFRLLAGERRVTAARAAGLSLIPAIIRPVTDEADEREIELYENTFRKDFTWDESAKLVMEVDRLNRAKDSDWSGRKTAELLGYGKSQIALNLRVAEALEIMPELATTADSLHEAVKVLKKLEEQHVTSILAERQQTRMAAAEYNFIVMAKKNYRLGDMFKGLSELTTNKQIGFIECDPPYGIDLVNMKKVEGATSTVDSYNEIPLKEYPEFITDLASECFRVAGTNCWMIMWYGPSNHELVRKACVDAGWEVNDIPGIWAKPSGQTIQPSTNLANCYEPFFVCRKGQPVLSKQGRSNVFNFTPTAGQKKYHPTERPLALMQEVLATFCHLGTLIMVPCLGSGVTLRACYLEGVLGFGWDLNPEYKDKFLLAVEDDMNRLNKKETSDD
jgi:ParB/RepB/Spo0J family partition protein